HVARTGFVVEESALLEDRCRADVQQNAATEATRRVALEDAVLEETAGREDERAAAVDTRVPREDAATKNRLGSPHQETAADALAARAAGDRESHEHDVAARGHDLHHRPGHPVAVEH